jgi:hypothetical protein
MKPCAKSQNILRMKNKIASSPPHFDAARLPLCHAGLNADASASRQLFAIDAIAVAALRH